MPDDPIARLSYYLHCYSRCAEGVPQRLRQYEYYRSFTTSEISQIENAALQFNPKLLEDKQVSNHSSPPILWSTSRACSQIFIEIDNNQVLGSSSNKFLRFSEISKLQLLSSVNLGIGRALVGQELGKNVETRSVMVYNQHWIRTYYYEPLARLKQKKDDCVIS